jgi:hypothetical protein
VLLSRSTIATILSAVLFLPPAFASHVHRAPTSGKSNTSSRSKTSSKAKTSAKASSRTRRSSRRARRVRGQKSIDSERATQIQQALIREHYLTGDPSGSWDSASISAMQKYQSDHGWQTKLTPDARALKKLGLGPDYSTAINAKQGNFAPPPPEGTIPTEQASGFAAAAGVNQ